MIRFWTLGFEMSTILVMLYLFVGARFLFALQDIPLFRMLIAIIVGTTFAYSIANYLAIQAHQPVHVNTWLPLIAMVYATVIGVAGALILKSNHEIWVKDSKYQTAKLAIKNKSDRRTKPLGENNVSACITR